MKEQTLFILVLFTITLATTLASPILHNATAIALNYRLPQNVQPIHYTIKLIPLLPSLDDPQFFYGDVQIRVRIVQETDTITLHYNDMTINTLTVEDSSGNAVSVADMYNSETHLYFIVILEGHFQQGAEYTIKMTYTGNHRDDMYGFYRSYYRAEDGSTKWLATTQFQPVHARRAYPCFDEPVLKATFEISVKRRGNLRAISNMPLKSAVDPDWDNFETTPRMSAYLTAFIVSDFTSHGDEFYKIWSRTGAIDQSEYSYSIAQKTLEAMEVFLNDYKYDLPKMDEVAIPDFSAGAMENWGLCTYRERLILYDKTTANAETKQRIATVVAHEFAHQWFGDLVSPEWWNFLWLNEGFATYFESFATAMVETDWRMTEQFVVRDVHSSMSFDALGSTHPMTQAVDSPDSIRAIFDSISYEKAGSVIRMMEHFVRTSVFKSGLNKYLTNRNHDYANEDHLFQAIDEDFQASGSPMYENVVDVMHTWTQQPGHPLITVTVADNNQLTLTQERFYFTQPETKPNSLWTIPLTYLAENGDFTDTSTKAWMKTATYTINRPGTADSWYLFNVQQVGYYRVNYDETNWNRLIAYLDSDNYSRIHAVNRAHLLNDALSLARAGVIPYGTALDLTRYLAREKDYIPWYSALTALSFLKQRIAGTESEDTFKAYITKEVEEIYYELEFEEAEDDSHITKLHRGMILQWACEMDHDHCITTARDKFDAAHVPSPRSAIPADLQSVVYCTALRHGGETEWNVLWNKYQTTNFAAEQTTILTALGCTVNQTLIDNYLRLSITSGGHIRRQDAASVFSSVYTNPAGLELALSFLQREITSIQQFYGTGVISIISGIASRISTQEQLNKFEAFVSSTNLGAATASAQRAVETARENLQWYNLYREEIRSWLNNEMGITDPPTTQTSPSSTVTAQSTQTSPGSTGAASTQQSTAIQTTVTAPSTQTASQSTITESTTASATSITLNSFAFVLIVSQVIYFFKNY